MPCSIPGGCFQTKAATISSFAVPSRLVMTSKSGIARCSDVGHDLSLDSLKKRIFRTLRPCTIDVVLISPFAGVYPEPGRVCTKTKGRLTSIRKILHPQRQLSASLSSGLLITYVSQPGITALRGERKRPPDACLCAPLFARRAARQNDPITFFAPAITIAVSQWDRVASRPPSGTRGISVEWP